MSEKAASVAVNLTAPVSEICRRLKLDPDDVREIVLRPTQATVTLYRRRRGQKYLQAGEAAVKTRTFAIRIGPR
jgi:CO/xanthine dehydrogenase Mo-binding subunit